nr:uncharacterized protein At4g19900 [Ipomoea batatas]
MFRNLRSGRRPRYGAQLCAPHFQLNNPLVDDLADPDFRSSSSDDCIDEFDDAIQLNSNDEDNFEPEEEDGEENNQNSRASSITYFYDHQIGVLGFGYGTDESKEAIGSDDFPVDEKMRKKLSEVRSIEDALLLKGSPLREDWGDWFNKKSLNGFFMENAIDAISAPLVSRSLIHPSNRSSISVFSVSETQIGRCNEQSQLEASSLTSSV